MAGALIIPWGVDPFSHIAKRVLQAKKYLVVGRVLLKKLSIWTHALTEHMGREH
jgi:hypothetical protein